VGGGWQELCLPYAFHETPELSVCVDGLKLVTTAEAFFGPSPRPVAPLQHVHNLCRREAELLKKKKCYLLQLGGGGGGSKRQMTKQEGVLVFLLQISEPLDVWEVNESVGNVSGYFEVCLGPE